MKWAHKLNLSRETQARKHAKEAHAYGRMLWLVKKLGSQGLTQRPTISEKGPVQAYCVDQAHMKSLNWRCGLVGKRVISNQFWAHEMSLTRLETLEEQSSPCWIHCTKPVTHGRTKNLFKWLIYEYTWHTFLLPIRDLIKMLIVIIL